mmetsp:Transcript_35386/g.80314  ORF Transcript_35386/g.80314 Transcript_35386/m.80314 type:complete len:90 (-) Transcript_35386:425-694(-)
MAGLAVLAAHDHAAIIRRASLSVARMRHNDQEVCMHQRIVSFACAWKAAASQLLDPQREGTPAVAVTTRYKGRFSLGYEYAAPQRQGVR